MHKIEPGNALRIKVEIYGEADLTFHWQILVNDANIIGSGVAATYEVTYRHALRALGEWAAEESREHR